jgi:hypothetical protein
MNNKRKMEKKKIKNKTDVSGLGMGPSGRDPTLGWPQCSEFYSELPSSADPKSPLLALAWKSIECPEGRGPSSGASPGSVCSEFAPLLCDHFQYETPPSFM